MLMESEMGCRPAPTVIPDNFLNSLKNIWNVILATMRFSLRISTPSFASTACREQSIMTRGEAAGRLRNLASDLVKPILPPCLEGGAPSVGIHQHHVAIYHSVVLLPRPNVVRLQSGQRCHPARASERRFRGQPLPPGF